MGAEQLAASSASRVEELARQAHELAHQIEVIAIRSAACVGELTGQVNQLVTKARVDELACWVEKFAKSCSARVDKLSGRIEQVAGTTEHLAGMARAGGGWVGTLNSRTLVFQSSPT